MPFNSLEYLIFFLLVLAVTWMVVGLPRLRLWILLLASYYFYITNNYWLISLILVSTQIDYLAALGIERTDDLKKRRALLLLSIASNLSILGFFKYCNFFAGAVADLAGAVGWPLSWVELNIMLPVGISFYTFQSMSYTIDVYRGDMKAERSWLRFSFFVAFFPQLVAGPIVRPQNFLPQLNKRPQLTVDQFESSMALIFFGLVKKLLLGDFLAEFVDPVFSNPESASCMETWLAIYAFTFQIYFDFSGYSDIAIGCSRLLGYELPENFRRPYAAISFSDFWKRWHISLSSWLRDYLYISLGGNRMPSKIGVWRNLMITMVLGGLWHGAAWNFVIWGTLHGLYLIGERILDLRKQPQSLWLRVFVIFHCVVFTWIVFRAESISQITGVLFGLTNTAVAYPMTNGQAIAWLIIFFGFLTQFLGERWELRDVFSRQPVWAKGTLFGALAIAVLVFGSSELKPFIYFRF